MARSLALLLAFGRVLLVELKPFLKQTPDREPTAPSCAAESPRLFQAGANLHELICTVVAVRSPAAAAGADEAMRSDGALRSADLAIALIGDSTLRLQYLDLCTRTCARVERAYEARKVVAACAAIIACGEFQVALKVYYAPYQIFTKGKAGRAFSAQYYFGKALSGVDIDFAYCNVGLHLLHLEPALTWSLQKFHMMAHFPDYLAHHIADIRRGLRRKDGSPARIIWMTTHSICNSRYFGDYAAITENSTSSDARLADFAVEPCLAWMETHEADYEARYGQPMARGRRRRRVFCRNTMLTHAGTLHLFHATTKVLAYAEHRNVSVVDAFALTDGQCWATPDGDGRHYPQLVLDELRALFLTILEAPD
mmetsp:Transcript_31733/g.109096  ORF Transcript_31733/g.109096 Transcript_31733/m.109096 type:complete len:368 (+) Transcript_31733:48-1151(+)